MKIPKQAISKVNCLKTEITIVKTYDQDTPYSVWFHLPIDDDESEEDSHPFNRSESYITGSFKTQELAVQAVNAIRGVTVLKVRHLDETNPALNS